MYRINNHKDTSKIQVSNHLAKAVQTGQLIFHAKDLANIWGITKANTLHTTLKRYQAQGLLQRLHKGMYSLMPADTLPDELIGIKTLHGYCYVSTETILARAGLWQQILPAITLIGQKSRRIPVAGREFVCRRLADKYLYNTAGLDYVNGILTASVERAVADLLYYNPKAHIDGADRIDWTAVKSMQKAVGYLN